MAMRGPKTTATVVKLVRGNPGRRKLNAAEPRPTGRPVPPVRLSGRPRALWQRFVIPAWWLTHADSQKCYMWVHLAAAFEGSVAKPDDGGPPPRPMQAAFLAQLRALGSELGFDPASRARFGAPPAKGKPEFDLD